MLLSALTEMLGCEEDEEAAALSPFDTLPDSELLSQPDRCSVVGSQTLNCVHIPSLSSRLLNKNGFS